MPTASLWRLPFAARDATNLPFSEVREAHVFHMRDGKVVEFWNASADQYAFDELTG